MGAKLEEKVAKRKDNSRKHHYEREQWMKKKKEGRGKQVWIEGDMIWVRIPCDKGSYEDKA